jgi:para-aminobenzoate synthetase component 1
MIRVRECDVFEPSRLARGLSALGYRDTALFESTLPGHGERGRWSMIGFAASRRFRFTERAGWTAEGAAPPVRLAAFESALRAHGTDPWAGLVAAGSAVPVPERGAAGGPGGDLPPFRGGFAVALSYDAVRLHPAFRGHWIDRARDDRPWPLLDLRLYGAVGALDHAGGRAFWIACDHPFLRDPPEARLEAAAALAVRALAAAGPGEDPAPAPAPAAIEGAWRSNMSDADYARAFERLQEYLRAGDLYQANLTRRFDAPCALDAPALYARLRRAAPAPYACLLDDPVEAVASASPELFLARRGDGLVTRPIKGTRPRDPDPARDRALAAELLASAKDRAEHVMIVDVHRNDLGRVCAYGSVRVPALAAHEAFPTVHHLTSTIEGRLAGGADADANPWPSILAAFPAGSISGAPKGRACEVIEELEPTRRALYCGALGWWDLGGDFALNVAIRTILLSGGVATFQSGGGIVIDSNVELEAAETWSKARALHAAVLGTAEVTAP